MIDRFVIYTLCTVSAYTAYRIMRKYSKKRNKKLNAPSQTKDGRRLSRRISFTSASMAMGAFPPQSNMAQPIINGVLYFAPNDCPSDDELMEVVRTMLQFERCAGVPVGTMGGNDWRFRECSDVNEGSLVRVLEFEGGEEELLRLVEEHMQDDLREGRGDLPWWELLVLKNAGNGRSAVVFRIEHCLADGLSLVTLFESLVSYADGSPMEEGGLIPSSMNRKFQQKKAGRLSLFYKSLKSTLKVLTLPSSKFDDGVAFRNGIGGDMCYSGKRKAVIFNTVSLDFIKSLKNAAGVSINDVFLACFSQAVRDYNLHENCPVMKSKGKNVQFRALMPLAFPRPREEARDRSLTLRNKWVFVSSKMGLGIENIVDRLRYVNNELTKQKKSPEAFCQLKVQESIPPKLPLKLARQTVYDLFTRHSVVFANVPGPPKECTFARRSVVEVQILFNNLIPQVEILSYMDRVFMNLVLDSEAVPHCELIPIFFSRALVSLAKEFKVDVPANVSEHAEKVI
eukprot:CAMPEP_0172488820 /NCGR_PEP_ID=MMETSP1066-20121228/18541_1 /TAXON_ID=671091 /ORGANISM="Coscinodiscus wailesii, Strain CCMP2513" /LENGTH=510 /DNA_ID=CAMNT_0013256289 /DNA_START=204 /DNA_END=1736 /DNA_ORIENTATION=+